MLELQAGGQRGFGDLELLGRRLRGRDPVLELLAGLREGMRDAALRVARHPAEDLRRRAERADLRSRARGVAPALGRARRERVADRGCREQRADQVGAAALVLLRARLAVLVRADRDVLGAVVAGELRATQRVRRRREREDAAD